MVIVTLEGFPQLANTSTGHHRAAPKHGTMQLLNLIAVRAGLTLVGDCLLAPTLITLVMPTYWRATIQTHAASCGCRTMDISETEPERKVREPGLHDQ